MDDYLPTMWKRSSDLRLYSLRSNLAYNLMHFPCQILLEGPLLTPLKIFAFDQHLTPLVPLECGISNISTPSSFYT